MSHILILLVIRHEEYLRECFGAVGGSGLIGRVVVDHFIAAGAKVSSLDIAYPSDAQAHATQTNLVTIHCDVASEESIQQAFATAIQIYGPVEICIALASLDLSVLEPSSFADASFAQLRRVLDVNVAGTWLTAREWIRGLRQAKRDSKPLNHPNLVIIGSESGHFGERQNAEYSLGKSAVQGGLLMSLRAEVPRQWQGARVNVVAPGPVQTERWFEECKSNPDQYYFEAQATTALCEPVPVKAVAMSILAVASHNFSSHVHGQILNVDGGKQGKVVWTRDEVV
ncbi:NAD(P)-binding protein [Dothidotthia symphoricarpi CBS 119687]|uniref:NAD(P)-binding protein n=1 Tax=Dothidotthia symphoricarpi CBS 119687 TaxID=1392245 RepID=A0A6A6A0B4_9PLEO|nr:NAD(P)-binding protein [Dothidotthia symphoricarpi CBS 119687]KAF2125452.1 NAD(P)-binding protein [Dothidotthia symphoricarpi CBS 119687]